MLIKVIFTLIAPMAAGLVVGINLVHLIGINANYEAAWWKVAVVPLIGIGCWFFEKQ